MFHLTLLLAYTIPNVYVFFRIRQLFISKRYLWWYVPVYLIVAGIFPVTQIWSHRATNELMQLMSDISDYLLPFYLYLFLSVILFELLLLINLLFKAVSTETRQSLAFRFYSLAVIIILPICIIIAGAINLNTIRTTEYRVEIPRRHSKTDHLRVAFVSDIHIQHNTRVRFLEQYAEKMYALRPDFILYGGDLLEGDSNDENSIRINAILQKLHHTHPAFGVLGNHELYGEGEDSNFFRESGITLLCDTVAQIDSSFYLAGRNDQHIGQRKTLDELLGGISHDLPVIILDHRPTALQEVSRSIADMQLSGHTHNGQLFPVNLIIRRIYELTWGYRKIGNTHFFVSSGLRLWGPPVKTAGKSEILLVDIFFK
jgi:uncharacterized protein